MSTTSYLTIAKDGEAEVVVDKSRFRATATRVESELAARAVLEQLRREHWSARHHCSAFVVGADRALERSNDDGEPTGTGGAPMLEVIRGRRLSDVVVVVTRWSGGVLLGTGNLARAYADATRTVLDEVGTVERVLQDTCSVSVDHAQVGRLEHELRARGATVLGVEYADQAELRLAVPPRARGVAEEIVAELTEGEASLHVIGHSWVDR